MKKSFLSVLFCMVVLNMLLPQIASAASVLQISTDPGVSIWLNNENIGKTTREQNGLVIEGLAPGEYVLKASMQGFDSREMPLKVQDNQVIEWHIKLTKPVMRVEDSVKRIDSFMIRSTPTGSIILKSIPLNAKIYFDGEPIGATDKKLTYVAAADHTVKFVFQNRELTKRFSLKPDESVMVKADFMKGEIVSTSAEIDSGQGPIFIKLETGGNRKPAVLFSHRKHQDLFECSNCHHGMDNEGKRLPYSRGMEIQRCVICHNLNMENKQLNSIMRAAHRVCKDCHKKTVEESGTAGPIDMCIRCHNTLDEK